MILNQPNQLNNAGSSDREVFNLLAKKYHYYSEYLQHIFEIIPCLDGEDQVMLLRSLTIQIKTFKIPLCLLIEEKQDYISKIVQLSSLFPSEIKELIINILGSFWFEKKTISSIPGIKNAALAMGVHENNVIQLNRKIDSFEEIYIKIRDLNATIKAFMKKLSDKSFKLDRDDVKYMRLILSELRNCINKDLKSVNEVFYESFYGYFNAEAQKLTEIEDSLLSLLETKKISEQEEEKMCEEVEDNSVSSIKKNPRQAQIPMQIELNQESKSNGQSNKKPKSVSEDMDPKFRTSFNSNELLQFEESRNIEYKNYFWPFNSQLINQLKRQICGFLNSIGGRIYIGISDDQVVHGIKLDSKERDTIRNEIVNYTKDFYPACRTTHIRVDFVPIKKEGGNFIKNLWVIKVIVSQGDPSKLYSMVKFVYQSFMRMHGQCVTLGAEEIEKEIVTRSQKPGIRVDLKEFDDQVPERPFQEMKDKEPKNISQEIKTNEKIGNINPKASKAKPIFDRIIPKNSKFLKVGKQNPQTTNINLNNQNPAAGKQTGFGVSVRGIPPDYTDEAFKLLFQTFDLVSLKPVYLVKNNGKCTGQGYVNFKTLEQGN